MKFIKIYKKNISPLTSLLKNNGFLWSEVIKQVFLSLKDSMCTTLVLEVLYFTNTFLLQCDASSSGLGMVLIQQGHPLAFTTKQLCDLNLGKSIYEKEKIGILHAMET
jgi:hypothetical protein